MAEQSFFENERIQHYLKANWRELIRLPILKTVLTLTRPHLASLGVLLLGNTLFAILRGAEAIYILIFLRQLLNLDQDAEASSGFSLMGFDFPLPEIGGSPFWGVLGLVFVLVFSSSILHYLLIRHSLRIRKQFIIQLKSHFFEKVLQKNLNFFSRIKTADIMTLATDVISVSGSIFMAINTALGSLLSIIITIVVMLNLVKSLTVFLVIAFIIALIIQRLLSRSLAKVNYDAQLSRRTFQEILLNSIYGIRLIKSTGLEKNTLKRSIQAMSNHEQDLYVKGLLNHRLAVLQKLVLLAILIGFFLILKLTRYHVLISANILLPFIYLSYRLLGDFTNMDQVRLRVINLLPQMLILNDFLNRTEYDSEIWNTKSKAIDIQETLSIHHLCFAYKGHEETLNIENLSFKKGTATAIVGLSGSGKSTLLDILCGLQTPQSGELRCDGELLNSEQRELFQQQVGYASQESILFNDTLKANLSFGAPEASEEAIQRALHWSVASEFVQQLPEGLQTEVGERGLTLSGGQRQRINLARILINTPKVILLDEATNALDLITESQIYERLLELKQETIMIVVAHRLSAIKDFDNIVVMNHGKVEEQGSHEELMQQKHLYFNLYNLQRYEV